ncbi:FMN-binding protein [Atribacter laminatus]|uniref:Electron transport complex subunit RnfG n=1 Tax=Atribacter laminatus TaxID=2847778 RepID=A0A7T1ALC4_ATRLM|nr:FMN-binding protein [Atribacter laminatus]QPM67979.1 Electron transport complex subunit RnfG [Atribacter laminatus]
MGYKKLLLTSILFLSIFLFVGVLWAESASSQIDENTLNQLKRVFAGADTFERFPGVLPESSDGIVIQEIYQAFVQGTENGLIFKISSPGYRDNIVVLIAFSSLNNQVVGIQILEQNETPSLGDLITQPNFLVQFLKKSINAQFELGDDIEAISGATVSSAAVAKACQEAASFLLNKKDETDNN